MNTIAILGAGKLGVVLAQLGLEAGYTVKVAGSGDPSKIELTMSVLAPGSKVGRAEEVIPDADAVILALPLGKFRNLPAEMLKDTLVIDAMNYWWEVDGRSLNPEELLPSSSEFVQRELGLKRVVKAFNHMGYHDLADHSLPPGAPARLAMAVAGDSPKDVRAVAELVDSFGFDPVPLGSLHQGKVLEPGQPGFGAALPKDRLQELLGVVG
ncbi:NADPH-dependent F420 reductase [Corynebacterium kozikiae]|uniref:NADPH-dependent F420 reductase n=1 Tax=Corynebacterium kozikiae TaxID=2968469 RepID=UPI00211C4211|nr:NAD(P)-binding domain-containing protein [Corynebacterium sp. 76QC2CO]MCQ9343421.1 NAD(P)-binding domain-containing protein [Corynebacterium sp. 76QC2CO]